MSCGNNGCRSIQTAYNNATQAYLATGSQLSILGTQVIDIGNAIDTSSNGFTINSCGLYRFTFNVVSVPSGAAVQTVQIYLDGTAVPNAISEDTTVSGAELTQRVETILQVKTCRMVKPVVSVWISGGAGAVSHVEAEAVKV